MPTDTEVKAKHRATWAAGEYDRVADSLHLAQDHVVRVARPVPGERVLDVATGTGNTAIKARAMGARVTGMDLTPDLLQVARKKAEAMGFGDIRWDEGDAERMPYADASFDVTLSTCGHMFAPDHAKVAAELVRVTRPGGRIVFMAWTPDGGVGGLFQVMQRHVPAPPGAPSPFAWGRPERVQELLGAGVKDVRFETGDCVHTEPSAEALWGLYASKYGPPVRALASREGDKRAALERDGLAFYRGYVTPVDGKCRWGREYVLTSAIRR